MIVVMVICQCFPYYYAGSYGNMDISMPTVYAYCDGKTPIIMPSIRRMVMARCLRLCIVLCVWLWQDAYNYAYCYA